MGRKGGRGDLSQSLTCGEVASEERDMNFIFLWEFVPVPLNPNTVLYTPVRTVMVRPKRKIILSSRRNRPPSKPSRYHIMATKSEMLRPFPVFFSKLPKPSSLPLPPQTTFQKMWFVYNILTNSVLNSLCERHSQTKPAK